MGLEKAKDWSDSTAFFRLISAKNSGGVPGSRGTSTPSLSLDFGRGFGCVIGVLLSGRLLT